MDVDNNVPRLAALTGVLGELSQADGSASLTHGNTSVHAAVYGPCEVRVSKEIIDRATVEIVFQPKAGLPGCAEKFREKHIREVFQASLMVSLHPRSSIRIVLQEREDGGALLASSINAACLALLDAGVSMKFMVAAIEAVIDNDGNVSLHPVEKQNSTGMDFSASMLVVFSDKDYNIMGVTSSGKFSSDLYNRCVDLCRDASKKVFKFYRESLEHKLIKSV